MNYDFLHKLRTVRVKDILSLFLFLLALPISKIYKLKRKHIWLICEYGQEARDNAFYLFKYLCKKHPEVDAVYALSKSSVDYKKVSEIGEVINYGGLKHWIFYLAAEANISSQKGGKPNAAICYLLEVLTGVLKNTRIFLQHGIILNDLPFLHYDKTKLSLFVCSVRKEFFCIRDNYGYPKGSVVLTGMCRYDALMNKSDGGRICIIPTWREWLYHTHDMEKIEGTKNFLQTVYYKMWSSVLLEILKQYDDTDLQIDLYLHRNMQQYNCYFSKLGDRLNVISATDGDVAEVLKRSACLITDYSSVANDFAYMNKPLAYFQPDHEQFHKFHLSEGYFSYKNDGFGEVCYTQEKLLEWLDKTVSCGFVQDEKYANRIENFFEFRDAKNCERNYLAIKSLLAEKVKN